MSAAGRVPGCFFRRAVRSTTDAILTCRLIDRPLRPAFGKGLRNEVQVVVTVMSIAPDEIYNTVAINAASMSTTLSGMPFQGPVGGVRMALMAEENGGHQWIAFPKHSQLENAVFDMAVAGRVVTTKDGGQDLSLIHILSVLCMPPLSQSARTRTPGERCDAPRRHRLGWSAV